jgi:hypothetical protein
MWKSEILTTLRRALPMHAIRSLHFGHKARVFPASIERLATAVVVS